MNYKILISENSNCKKFSKNYFHIMKPHCKNTANTQSPRKGILIFYEMLGLIMKMFQLLLRQGSLCLGFWSNLEIQPQAVLSILFPPSIPPFFFYWESHSHSLMELTSATVLLSCLNILLPQHWSKIGQAGTSARSSYAMSLKSEEAQKASFVHACSWISERDKFQSSSSL